MHVRLFVCPYRRQSNVWMSTLVLGVWVFCVMVCLMRDVKSELFTYVVSLISSLSIIFVLRKNVYHDNSCCFPISPHTTVERALTTAKPELLECD